MGRVEEVSSKVVKYLALLSLLHNIWIPIPLIHLIVLIHSQMIGIWALGTWKADILQLYSHIKYKIIAI